MSIFIDKNTKVLIQGITGKEGSFWTKHMQDMGTKITCGVTPGKKGQKVEGIPVYNSVREAVAEHEAEASMLFVPAPLYQRRGVRSPGCGDQKDRHYSRWNPPSRDHGDP